MDNNENEEFITKEQLNDLKELLKRIDSENKLFDKTKELIKEKEEQDKNKGMNK